MSLADGLAEVRLTHDRAFEEVAGKGSNGFPAPGASTLWIGPGALSTAAERLAPWLAGRPVFVVAQPPVLDLHGDAFAALLDTQHGDRNVVHGLEDIFGNTLRNELGRRGVLAHLVDGENTVADKVRGRRRKLGKDETGAVTQDRRGRQMDRLEVLRLAWRRTDRHLFLAEQRVDRG